MLDIKFIRENPDKMKKVCQAKGIELDIDYLLSLDKKRRDLIKKSEELRFQQKKLGKEKREKAKKIKGDFKKIRTELKKIEKEYEELMLLVPNIHSDDTPIGPDESGNKEVYLWGKIPKFDFPIKDHIQLGKDLDLIDFKKGVKVSGFRGYFLKNEYKFRFGMASIVFIEAGIWNELKESDGCHSWKKEIRKSYAWDNWIRILIDDYKNEFMDTNSPIEEIDTVYRQMALENRITRISFC